MAGALARGLGQPVAVFDVDRSRAEALAEAVGGQVLDSNIAVAEASDAIVLCHKPAQLRAVGPTYLRWRRRAVAGRPSDPRSPAAPAIARVG